MFWFNKFVVSFVSAVNAGCFVRHLTDLLLNYELIQTAHLRWYSAIFYDFSEIHYHRDCAGLKIERKSHLPSHHHWVHPWTDWFTGIAWSTLSMYLSAYTRAIHSIRKSECLQQHSNVRNNFANSPIHFLIRCNTFSSHLLGIWIKCNSANEFSRRVAYSDLPTVLMCVAATFKNSYSENTVWSISV